MPLADLPDEGWHKPEIARGKIGGPARWTDGRGCLPKYARQIRVQLIPELRA